MITIILAIIAILLTIFYRFLTVNFSQIKGNAYFKTKPWPLFGTLQEFNKARKLYGNYVFQSELKKTRGSIHGDVMGRNISLTIHDSKILKRILVDDFDKFYNKWGQHFQGLLTHSLLFVNGETWKRQRKLLSPIFTMSKLKEIIPKINKSADRAVKTMEVEIIPGVEFDIQVYANKFAFDAIASSQFGVDIEGNNSDSNQFLKCAKDLSNISTASWELILRVLAPWLCKVLETLRIKTSYHSIETTHFFNGFVKKLFNTEKSEGNEQKNLLNILKKSLQNEGSPLDVSLHSKTLSVKEIAGNAALFLVGGYDSTSSTLSFLAYSMASNPGIQERLFEEIDKVLANESEITYEMIMQMHYLEMCIDETLRMYPPFFQANRVCLKDCKYDDVEIRKNWVVFIPIRAIHMDPDKWTNPEQFNPERFTPELKASRDQAHYLPFGIGKRNCIGMKLAQLELKVGAISMFRRYKFHVSEKTDEPLLFDNDRVPITAKNGIWLKAELR